MGDRPILQSGVPILASLDISKTVQFYTGTLGFVLIHQEPDYAIVERDAVAVHFWACNERHIAENTACRIGVSGIAALFDEYGPKGVLHPKGELKKEPWRSTEFAIVDPDGNLITFFEDEAKEV